MYDWISEAGVDGFSKAASGASTAEERHKLEELPDAKAQALESNSANSVSASLRAVENSLELIKAVLETAGLTMPRRAKAAQGS